MLETDSINAVIALIYFAAIPLTVLLSAIVRKRYRRAIVASMMTVAPLKESAFTTAPPRRPNGAAVQFDAVDSRPRMPLRRRLGLRYLLAGIVYALCLTVLMFLLNDMAFLPVRTTVVVLSFATPALLMAMLITGFRWYWTALAFVFWTWALYQIAPESNDIIGMLALPGALIALLLANPRLRTTTVPLYLVAVAFLIPLLFVLDVLLAVMVNGPFDALIAFLPPTLVLILDVVLSLALVTAVGIGLAWVVLRLVGWLTAGSSELMMQCDALWMFQTLWMIGLGFGEHGLWVLLYLLAFLAYRGAVRVLRGSSPPDPDLLLLLRVFGKRASQQKLARGALLNWRQKGPVMLIGSDDLATETLDASELAAFLTRRLGTLFINSPRDLDAALARGANRLGDGLYPMQDYYCRDNSWRPTIKTLMDRASSVMLDLRGFTADNLGVQFEIDQLAQRVAASTITVLYDDSTDVALAQKLFTAAWSTANDTTSPQADRITFQRA